mmetsp:Transcript_11970/g.39402  ORF Transcript_11970/g.39402 Transcript_11970/m.39402 type:complete len:102 (-) Transcript_11970:104-409(-)
MTVVVSESVSAAARAYDVPVSSLFDCIINLTELGELNASEEAIGVRTSTNPSTDELRMSTHIATCRCIRLRADAHIEEKQGKDVSGMAVLNGKDGGLWFRR